MILFKIDAFFNDYINYCEIKIKKEKSTIKMKNEEKSGLQAGDIHQVELIDMTHTGEAVARVDNMIVFIEAGLPGDQVEIEVTKTKKNYAQGKLVKIIEPSPDRIEPPCEYAGTCGGCQLQAMSYEGQLRLKEKMVMDALCRIGGLEDINIKPIMGMEEPERYRNKAQYKVSPKGTGFYAKKSHQIVYIEDCLNQPESSADVIRTINEMVQELNLSTYNEKNQKGYLRGVIQRSTLTGENMIILVVNGKSLSHKDAIIEKLTAGIPNLKSIFVNFNQEKGNAILGKKSQRVWGAERIIERIGELDYAISSNSFFQINSLQTKKLYDQIKALADLDGSQVVADLYCGAGTIGLYLANQAKEVVGIEVVKDAVLDARENAGLNNIPNARFIQGKTETILSELVKKDNFSPDLIILDPPRKGCESFLLDTIGALKTPKIIYVSCNPSTLARDLKILGEMDYEVKVVQPIDLFPGTGHVESVVLLERKEK